MNKRYWTEYSLTQEHLINDDLSLPLVQEIANYYRKWASARLVGIYVRANLMGEALIKLIYNYDQCGLSEIKHHAAVKSVWVQDKLTRELTHLWGERVLWDGGLRYGPLSYSRSRRETAKQIYRYIYLHKLMTEYA